MGWFSLRGKPSANTAASVNLGADLVALRLDAGDVAPSATVLVVFGASGQARRLRPGKVACAPGETAFCFHPGPYVLDLAPFAAAPEWGLRVRVLVDAPNPHAEQQRFDLFLFAEHHDHGGQLSLAALGSILQTALQSQLAQGALDLPPCTTLDEWHAFRAGFNQLLYTRYGLTVDDCVPVDLAGQVDFAQVLQARAQVAAALVAETAPAAAVLHTMSALPQAGAPPVTPREPALSPAPQPLFHPQPALHDKPDRQDAAGLRRLFLELPVLSRDLRVLVLPAGPAIFQQHQSLLLRLGMASLNVDTMPSLAWAAPDQPLDAADQARRAGATAIAVAALDEAWSLLARLHLAGDDDWPALLDEADRLCANLETGLALRRAAHVPRQEPAL